MSDFENHVALTESNRETRSSTAAHTPGPWRAAYGDNCKPLPHEGNEEICCLPHKTFDAIEIFAPRRVCGPHNCSLEEFDANARLIAAAPDMLAALEHVLEAMCWHKIEDFEYRGRKLSDVVCEAHAKATGAA